MFTKIRKRDGRYVKFDEDKITNAIKAAFNSSKVDVSDNIVKKIVLKAITNLYNIFPEGKIPGVEDIQDQVEKALMESKYLDVAKHYILYRKERERIRLQSERLMNTYKDITFKKSTENDNKRENANVNSDTAMGAMLQYGSEGAKAFNKLFVLNPIHRQLHEEGSIHIHDLDFLTLTLTCCQIDLEKLFKGGFHTGHGSIREPKTIQTYAALTAIAIQSNQNDQHGGQSIPNFDYYLSDGVRKSYIKRFRENLAKVLKINGINEDAKEIINQIKEQHNVVPKYLNNEINPYLKEYLTKFNLANIDNLITFITNEASSEVENDTYQAMESLIHNLNTMHSRAGAQVPFSSINYGTDTSNEGRLVVRKMLEATQAGLGEHETAIFPIQIFKVKDGINYKEGDPNYDLFKLAIKVTSERLFPNFSFIDAPYNLEYYDPNNKDTEIAYMGCRTRVMANEFDKSKNIVTGRGNLSFTSINLPRLAIVNKTIDKFMPALDSLMDEVIKQLLERYEIQKKLHVYNFPFLMGEGVWINSDKLDLNDTIEKVIAHGTLSIGFIGLAECLKVLTGKHHGEDHESQKLGLKIISFMRKKMDDASKKYHLNFSLLATPAEGLSGRFVKIDQKLFGKIKDVTDHKFYTNSFHIPVYYPITAFEKISLEAPYHALTNAGHISYIELDGDTTKNLDAVETIIRHMKEQGIGYGSINHPLDRDPKCGYRGIINDECPKCHRKESENAPFERIRRITGYLVGTLDRFNDAKRAEVKERVKHGHKH